MVSQPFSPHSEWKSPYTQKKNTNKVYATLMRKELLFIKGYLSIFAALHLHSLFFGLLDKPLFWNFHSTWDEKLAYAMEESKLNGSK